MDALLMALAVNGVSLDHVQHASQNFRPQQRGNQGHCWFTHLACSCEERFEQFHGAEACCPDFRYDELGLVNVVICGLVVENHQAVVGHVSEECLEQFVDFLLVFIRDFLV
jgi:hypothetical protein